MKYKFENPKHIFYEQFNVSNIEIKRVYINLHSKD